jgi:hypothetical protein
MHVIGVGFNGRVDALTHHGRISPLVYWRAYGSSSACRCCKFSELVLLFLAAYWH